MKTLEEYLRLADPQGHPRSGIILGVRLALAGLAELGLSDPEEFHDHLVVVVETDRCLPDAIELVTGCRLGNRRLKFRDMGKMAATLADTATGCAVRVAAREQANQRALELFPGLDKEEALAKAYCALPEAELFTRRLVRLPLAPQDLPGYHAARVACAQCGEGIAFERQIVSAGQVLCRACAGESYFEAL